MAGEAPIGRTEFSLLKQLDTATPGSRFELDILRDLDKLQAGRETAIPPISAEPISTIGVESGQAALQQGQEIQAQLEAKQARKEVEIKGFLEGTAPYELGSDFAEDSLDYWNIFDLGRSRQLSTQQSKFKESYPEGSLIQVPTSDGPVLMGRKTESSPYRQIGKSLLTGTLLSEPMALSIAGSRYGPFGTAGGTIVGVLGQQAIEEARGFGELGPGETLQEALIEGGIAGAADFVFRGAGRLIFGAPGAKDAVRAARELGVEPVGVGQVSESPFIRGLFRQVGVTSKKVEKKVAKELSSLRLAFKRFSREGGTEGVSTKSLQDIIASAQDELTRVLTSSPKTILKKTMGEALDEGIKIYREAGRRLVGRFYDKAIAISDDVVFSTQGTQKLAFQMKKGVPARTRAGETLNVQGEPIAEMNSILDDLLQLQPQIKTLGNKTGFEQMKALRSRLFDLKESTQGVTRGQAKRLWGSLSKEMDNPISGNPEFTAAYQKASAAHRVMEGNLEKSFIARRLTQDTPENLLANFAAPGNYTAVATMKSIVPRPQWKAFSEAFVHDMAATPSASRGLQKLHSFKASDPHTLDLLMSPKQQKDLTVFLTNKSRLESSTVYNVVQENLTRQERSLRLVKEGSIQDVKDLVRLAGGKESPAARSLKAAIYEDILNEASDITLKGKRIMNVNEVIKRVNVWRKSGKLSPLFDLSDWRRLVNVEIYTAPIAETADIGGGMMAGSIRQQAVQAVPETVAGRGAKILKTVVQPLIGNDIAAWMLSRPVVYKHWATRTGITDIVRRTAAALTVADKELSKREEQR